MRDQIVTRSTSAREAPPPKAIESCAVNILPREIWLEVMRVFTNRLDLVSLYRCAQTCRGLASLALRLLYSVHHNSPAGLSVIPFIKQSMILWRSLIASASGATLFPYCTFVKALNLSNFLNILEDVPRYPAQYRKNFQNLFFTPPLQDLKIHRGKAFDYDAIILEVANRIMGKIRAAADEEDKNVGITSLEGPYLPTASLAGWVSGLSMLRSLAVRDGSVLNRDVGLAIRENCPAFNEVTCYFCLGTDVDSDMAGFLGALNPNTLESFTITSKNELGQETFTALSQHAVSLIRLSVRDIGYSGLDSLDLIGPCPNLRGLTLESDRTTRSSRWTRFQDSVAWLQQCGDLVEVRLNIADGAPFLAAVLKDSEISLLSLDLQLTGEPDAFYVELAEQTQLRVLTIRFDREEDDEEMIGTDRHILFVDALTELNYLRHLILDEPLTKDDFEFVKCSDLERVYLNAAWMDEDYLKSLASLPRLKYLHISSPTTFTMTQLLNFIEILNQDPQGDHWGFSLVLDHQMWDYKFSEREEKLVNLTLKEYFGGGFEVLVQGDPDELHESDFSD